jgi:hypothetical protein
VNDQRERACAIEMDGRAGIAIKGYRRRELSKWLDPLRKFFVGTVPLATGAFRKIVVRQSRVAQVEVRDLSFLSWTETAYFEVCANPAVYEALPEEKSAASHP